MLVCSKLRGGLPFSIVRMSDGEKGILEKVDGFNSPSWLNDPAYLVSHGMAGVDLPELAAGLIRAGNEAGLLCCPLAGVYRDSFRLHPYWPNRARYGDIHFAYEWQRRGFLPEIYELAGSVAFVCKEAEQMAIRARDTDLPATFYAIPLCSWLDHDGAVAIAKDLRPRLVAIAGGPPGRILTRRIEVALGNAVVLDVGTALKTWV